MAFDSLAGALASSAELPDKIAFTAGYVGTYLVALTVVWGVPYLGYKAVLSRKVSKNVITRVDDSLSGRNVPKFTKEDEEAFDYDMSSFPDEVRQLFNAERRSHLEYWNQYGITGSIAKQAHFTQVLLRADCVVLWDPVETLERMRGLYWLIGMSENMVIEIGGNPLGFDSDTDDEASEEDPDENAPTATEDFFFAGNPPILWKTP